MSGLDHLPDARDGLTQLERRLLHALGPPPTPFRESRALLDSARRGTDFSRRQMYEALLRLVREWSMRYPLVDGEGNFGSIDGDPAAVSRYTEVRLAGLAGQLLGSNDVRVAPGARRATFDEAAALSGPLPNLLVNGASGGVAEFPPHRLTEVAVAVIARLERRATSLDDVLAILPGPDYPTGGELVDPDEIRAVYETGAGTMRSRGSMQVEGRRIVVTSIPFGTWKGGDDGMFVQAVDQIHEGPLAAIGNIDDESDRSGMRVVFEIRDESADPRVVRELLFDLTSLETEVPVLMVALVDGKPERLTLLEVIDHHLDHQRAVRSGSRDEIDAAIRRDLETLARASADGRRTKLPG